MSNQLVTALTRHSIQRDDHVNYRGNHMRQSPTRSTHPAHTQGTHRPKATPVRLTLIGVLAVALLTACGGSSLKASDVTTVPATSASVSATVSDTPTPPPATTAPPTPTPTPTPTPPLTVGASATTAIGTVTLLDVAYPYRGTAEARSIVDAGKQFAVVHLKVCPTVSEVEMENLRLIASDSTAYTFWNVQIGAETPDIVQSLLQPAIGVCTAGYLTFDVDPGKHFAQFVVVSDTGDATIWTLA